MFSLFRKAKEGVGDAAQNIGRFVKAVTPVDEIYRGVKGHVQGQQAVSRASTEHSFTPSFERNTRGTFPTVGSELNSGGLKSGQAWGTFTPKSLAGAKIGNSFIPLPSVNPRTIFDRINFSPDGAKNTDTVLHEGLHREYERMPQADRDRFWDTAQRNVGPRQRDYLKARTGTYKVAQGQDFKDFKRLPHGLAHEVHSYLPSAYYSRREPQRVGPVDPRQSRYDSTMPDELENYYKRYYNPDAPSQYQTALYVQDLLDFLPGGRR